MHRLALLLVFALVPAMAAAQPLNRPAVQRGYLHCQFVQADEALAMLWVKPTRAGHDLFLARRQSSGALQNPVQVNSAPGDVLYSALDDSRPALAASGRGKVGVAWYGREGGLFAAISADGGRSFAPAVTVDAGARNEAALVDAGFDATGTLFVTWVDTQSGTAVLRLARIDRDVQAQIRDLELESGVSACTRPDLAIRGRDLSITYRGHDAEGYRDLWRVRSGAQLEVRTPERLGPASWKPEICPPSGAASGGEFSWFVDGSTGSPRLVEAFSPLRSPEPIRAATVEGPRSPRLVTGSDQRGWMLYLPGAETGQVLVRESRGWRVLVDDVPWYCTDIALVDGQLLMVGDKENRLWLEAAAMN